MEFTYQLAFLCQVEQAEGNNARKARPFLPFSSFVALTNPFIFSRFAAKSNQSKGTRKFPGKRMLTN